MAITPRGTGSGNTAASFSATSVAGTKPSGLTTYDYMVASVVCRKADTTDPTGPTGWTKRSSLALGTSGNLSVWDKRADSTDVAASTFTWNWTGGGTGAVGIEAYRGVDLTTPRDATPVMGTATTGATATAPTMTTVTDGAMVLRIYGEEAGSGSGSFSQPTGYTEEYDVTSAAGSSTSATAMSDALQATAGATGTAASTVGGVGTNSVGFTMALRPAALWPEGTFSPTDNAASTSYVGNAPSGIVADEILIAHVFVRFATSGFSMTSRPSGWNIIDEWGSATTGGVSCLYWKLATASEPSTYTWVGNQSNASIVTVGRIANASTTAPIHGTVQRFTESTTGNSHSMPAVTTSVTNTLYFGVFTVDSSFVGVSSWGTLTAGWVLTTGTGQTTRGSLGGFESIPATGSTGTRTITTTDVFQGISQAFAIAPNSVNAFTPTATDTESTTDAYTSTIYRINRQAPDAILSLQGLTGTVSEIQDDPDSSDSNWLDRL